MTLPPGHRIILNFHGIGTPHAEVPVDETPYWISEARFAGILDRVDAHKAAGRDIRITFDDGNRSDAEIGSRALADRGMQGVFFVLTGRLDQEHYLSAADIRGLVEAGMRVGLHGRDHVDWRRLDRQGLEAETVTARNQLSEVVGLPIADVGIPFGAYNRRVIAHLLSQGYTGIFTSDGGSAKAGARIQPRTSLRADMDDATVDTILAARWGTRARLRRRASTFLRRRIV